MMISEKLSITYNNKELKDLKKLIDLLGILSKSMFFLNITLFLIMKYKYSESLAIVTFVIVCLNFILYMFFINYKSSYKSKVKEALSNIHDEKDIVAFLCNNNIKRVGNLVYILNEVCRLE